MVGRPSFNRIQKMEILIFALVAARKGYTQHATLVREAAKFQPIDFRPLRHSYSAEVCSLSGASVPKKWVMA
jgi:hypothetical protein